MIKRSRYNDSLREKRIERISKIKDAYLEEIRQNHHIEFNSKNIDKESLDKVKAKIRRNIVASERKTWFLTITTTILFVFGIYYIVRFLLSLI